MKNVLVGMRKLISRDKRIGPEVINIFSCSTQLSRKNTTLCLFEPEKTAEFLDIFTFICF